MPSEVSINYIELPAADFGAVQAFYQTVFGWSFESYGEQYLAFSDGKLDGGFYRSELKSSAEQGAALVIFLAANLLATEQAVIQAGGRILKPIFEFPGGRRFHFADPHGNELAVWEKM